MQGMTTQYVYTQGTADEASNGSNPLFSSWGDSGNWTV